MNKMKENWRCRREGDFDEMAHKHGKGAEPNLTDIEILFPKFCNAIIINVPPYSLPCLEAHLPPQEGIGE
jgi:hypothetical protein